MIDVEKFEPSKATLASIARVYDTEDEAEQKALAKAASEAIATNLMIQLVAHSAVNSLRKLVV